MEGVNPLKAWKRRREDTKQARAYEQTIRRLSKQKRGERVVEDADPEGRRPDQGEGKPGHQR